MNKETIVLVGKLLASRIEENVDLAFSFCDNLPISFWNAKEILPNFPADFFGMNYSIINKYLGIEEIIYNKVIHDKNGEVMKERYEALKSCHNCGEQFLKEKYTRSPNFNMKRKK